MTLTDRNRITPQRPGLSSAKSLRLNGDIAIQSCTHAEPTDEPLFTKENMLLFVMEGSLHIRYGTAAYTIGKNNMVLLQKDIRVEYSTASWSGYHGKTNFIVFYFKYDLLKEFAKLAQLSVPFPEHPSAVTIDSVHARLSKFIDSLELYFTQPETIDEYLTKIKLLELLFNLIHVDSNILRQLMDLRPHFRADLTTTLEDNLMTPKSLAQLAVLSGRSLSSFKRDFLAIYNMPPSTWVRHRRLEKAHELLLKTTMTVTDVCYTLGFENLAHFSRLFKSHFGFPPSRSRMQH